MYYGICNLQWLLGSDIKYIYALIILLEYMLNTHASYMTLYSWQHWSCTLFFTIADNAGATVCVSKSTRVWGFGIGRARNLWTEPGHHSHQEGLPLPQCHNLKTATKKTGHSRSGAWIIMMCTCCGTYSQQFIFTSVFATTVQLYCILYYVIHGLDIILNSLMQP